MIKLFRQQMEFLDLLDWREAGVAGCYGAVDQGAHLFVFRQALERGVGDALRLGPFRDRVPVDLDQRAGEFAFVGDDDAFLDEGRGLHRVFDQ